MSVGMLDLELLGQRWLFLYIDFSNQEIRPRGRDLLQNRRKHPAGTAPAGPEVKQHRSGGSVYECFKIRIMNSKNWHRILLF